MPKCSSSNISPATTTVCVPPVSGVDKVGGCACPYVVVKYFVSIAIKFMSEDAKDLIEKLLLEGR